MTSSSSWIRSINAAMPRAMRPGRLLRAREIWIDDALCRAPGCRRVALRQRRVAAFVIVGPPVVYVQANRISRIVRLGPSWCCRQNCRGRQNRQSRNAHHSLLRDKRGALHRLRPKCLSHCDLRSGLGRMFRSQPDRPFCSQSIHVRALGRAQYRGGSHARHVHEYFIGAVHVEYLKPLAGVPQRILPCGPSLGSRHAYRPRCALIETLAMPTQNRRRSG